MNKVALFDFDGTLVDSQACILACFKHLYELYDDVDHFTHTIQEEVLGPPLDLMMKKLFPNHDTNALIEEYRRYQKEEASDLLVCFDGCIELLKDLQNKGIQVGIVSTRKRDSIFYHMKRLGMDAFVDVVVGGDEVTHQKPSPDGILLALERLGCKDATLYFIGDNVIDIEAGKNANAFTIGKLGHAGKVEKLLNSGADACVYNLLEIKDIIQ